MRFPFSFWSGLLGSLFLFFCFVSQVRASSSDVILHEIMLAGTHPLDEFVELYNVSDNPVDLSGFQLRRRTASGSESSLKVFPKNTSIPAHGYFLWAHKESLFAPPFADSETASSSLADDNSIGLFTQSGGAGVLLDSIRWGKGAPFLPETPLVSNPKKGTSLIQDPLTRAWSTTLTPTPTNRSGLLFSPEPTLPEPPLSPPDPPAPVPPTPASPSPVRFHEILSNPAGDEAIGEFIELFNDSDAPVDIGGFHIQDASKTGTYSFPLPSLIKEHGRIVLFRSVSKISLNNSNESLSLFDTVGTLIDSVHFTKTKEGVSQNRIGEHWRGGTPTPGEANALNTLPETKERIPKKGYRGIPIAFDARGKDSDGSTLKYTWDFGDDHKSYKEKTRHAYEKNGTYTVTLTTTDGQDDVTETFSLTIESFPEPDVRITALVPNPSGKDADHEWLRIENRSKKSIDLKDFSIATGWKKLVNHPIKNSVVIAPKSTITLTREHALFTLPNQKGKIELRAPDGKTLQTIKYKLPRAVGEDVTYTKEKGKRWAWQDTTPRTTEKNTPTPPQSEEMLPPDETSALSLSTVSPTPSDVPDELENTALPEALPPEEEHDIPDDAQVLGATTTTPSQAPPASEIHPKNERSFSSWFEYIFNEMNARLNTWQNSKTAP